MGLKEIDDNIIQHLDGQSFRLCDETTTGTEDVSTLLDEAFQADYLVMKEVSHFYKDYIQLQGVTSIEQCLGVKLTVQFTEGEDNNIKLLINAIMPDDYHLILDEAKIIFLTQVTQEFERILGQELITGACNGTFVMNPVEFVADGKYSSTSHTWCMKFKAVGEFSSRDLVKAFAIYTGMIIPTEILPEGLFETVDFSYEPKGENLWDKLSLEVVTGCGLTVTEELALENLEIDLEKRNAEYSYTLKGNLRIGSSSLPVYLCYFDNCFDFGVDTGEEGCLLPSIEDIARLLGIKESLSLFPEELISGNNLKLVLLTTNVPSTLNSLNSFSATVCTAVPWSFFGIPGLYAKDIGLGFHLQGAVKDAGDEFFLFGTIEISGFDVLLSGMYSTVNGWTLSGGFADGEELNLNKLWTGIAEMLGLATVADLPLPQIALYDASVTFGLTKLNFSAGLKTKISQSESTSILDKLFSMEALVDIHSDSMGSNVRSYRGNLEGKLEIDQSSFTVTYDFDNQNKVSVKWDPIVKGQEITLTGILSFFGVDEIPEIISDLDFGISAVDMTYNIDEGILHILVKSKSFGEFQVKVSDLHYMIDLTLNKEIKLSMLPVIGKYMHLLDNVYMEHVELWASDQGDSTKDVLSGVALLGEIYKMPFVMQLYHSEAKKEPGAPGSTSGDLTKWFKIQKTIGSFEFHRFGISYREERLLFLLDASISFQPIGLDVMGLGLGMNISNPSDIGFYLSGVQIDYDNGGIALSGAFMKSKLGENDCYDGELLIKAGNLLLFAIGTYSGDSMLAYALLNKQIGGPPVFFVTGLSAGFGYNMQMNIPTIDKVAEFPLVSAAMGKTDKQNMLRKLKENISVRKGQIFLAAGVQFTSFQLLKSFALLTVTFGNYTEFNLLGLSQLSIPPKPSEGVEPLAFALLAMKASFSMKDGIVAIEARLTSESYLLSKRCKITGGFAFYIWMYGNHSGDFVLTLGGYHPNYVKPEHYPVVPRLGFSWDVTSDLHMNGDIYFALTPSTLMAGGRLNALYQKGDIKAWFTANADFYIAWKPFFYDISLFVGFGVSAKVKLLFVRTTIKVELSAGLHIWGPEFTGTARISLYVISFTIHFGAGSQNKPNDLKWSEFSDSFLPKEKALNGGMLSDDVEDKTMPIAISITGGQKGEEAINDETIAVVSAEALEILINSAIPVTIILVNQKQIQLRADMPVVGVLPMGTGNRLQSEMTIVLYHTTSDSCDWNCEPYYENVPAAMWGMEKGKRELLEGVATGIRIHPKETPEETFPKVRYIDLNELSVYEYVTRVFTWNQSWELPGHEQEAPIETFSATIMQESVCKLREDFLQEMNESGFAFDKEIDLSIMSAQAENIFTEKMILGVMI